MSDQPLEPSTDVTDADWLDQHTTEDDDADHLVSIGDQDVDPADRIDQSTPAGDDDEDDYARD